MKTRRMTAVALALVTVFSGARVWAIEIGDEPPPLKIKKWIKGEKFKLNELKNKEIVVLAFLQLTEPVSQSVVSSLSEMQDKFEVHAVRFVGIALDDSSSVMNEVEGFGGRLRFTIAVDNEGKTYAPYHQDFSLESTPHIFIVDRKGKLSWHGDPRDKDFAEELDDLVRDQPAPVDKDLVKAKKLLNEYLELAKQEDASAEKLKKLSDEFMKLGSKEKDFLLRVAGEIVKNRKSKHRDLDLALKAAEKAYELTKGAVCEVNELYARVYYEKGDYAEALTYLRKAVSVCEDFDHEDKLEKRIKSLKKKIDEK